MEVKKILQRPDGTKYIIVPRGSKLSRGDYVRLIKLEESAV